MVPDVLWLAQPVIDPFGVGARGKEGGEGERGLGQDGGVGNGDGGVA